ncbi:MAG: hypothetical protein E7638_05840 [Ruminococcaceae bacterium]|nr:hypothetical protein [Oscillospiraceae bacterium]
MKEEILNYLTERVGTAIAPGYYAEIDRWLSWWRGINRSFHCYFENGVGGYPIRRELYRMNMAKKICEDWAAVLMNEETKLTSEHEPTRQWLGENMNGSFFRSVNRLVEKTFASGTGACLIRLDGAELDANGYLCSASGRYAPRITYDFVDASHIIPITVRGGEITEAAFVSEVRDRGEELIYLEIHTLERDGYRIRNEMFRVVGSELERVENGCGVARDIRTGSPVPFFSILTPNLINHIDEGCGMGISVFADAIDCLKGVDLAFNNFCRDIRLGGKKVFINQSLICRDEEGNVYTPDDVAQQLFVTIGDTDLAEHPMITEHNPELRSEDNADAVQCQLDYLSFRCGLGTHHYQFRPFRGEAKITATQYMGERQDLRRNAEKHSLNLRTFLHKIAECTVWIGRELCGLPLLSDSAEIRFDDSYFTDSDSERSRDLSEVELGVMTVDEFRMKWYGKKSEVVSQ